MASIDFANYDIIEKLKSLQSSNTREVVGYLDLDPDTNLVTDAHVVAFGDDDKVVFREFRPFPFHTHPSDTLAMEEPPSGEDFLQSLTWGYPEFNETKKYSEAELVVSSEGFWWYAPSPELRHMYYALQDTAEHEQSLLAKRMCRYLNALSALFKNNLISREKFMDLVTTLQFSWLSTVLNNNPGFLKYLQQEFPLDSMSKLATTSSYDLQMPGFFIRFVNFK